LDRYRWHHAKELGITAQDLPEATRAAALVTCTRVELLCEAMRSMITTPSAASMGRPSRWYGATSALRLRRCSAD
jgi:glutamyl-tRNA reductase